MSIEAMKQALAKLESLWEIGIDAVYRVELLPEIQALRQAIEQAEYDKLTVKFGERAKEYLVETKKRWEQEPVRWFQQFGDAPPRKEWVGLTDEEGIAIANWQLAGNHPLRSVIQAIEAKLKEKNGG
jgi:hypothetical protein